LWISRYEGGQTDIQTDTDRNTDTLITIVRFLLYRGEEISMDDASKQSTAL